MECGDTPHSVISIWMQILIWIQRVNLHAAGLESVTVVHHSKTNLSLRTGVFRCLSTSVLNGNLHINSNQEYIWILHTQRKIVVIILYQLSVLSNTRPI